MDCFELSGVMSLSDLTVLFLTTGCFWTAGINICYVQYSEKAISRTLDLIVCRSFRNIQTIMGGNCQSNTRTE